MSAASTRSLDSTDAPLFPVVRANANTKLVVKLIEKKDEETALGSLCCRVLASNFLKCMKSLGVLVIRGFKADATCFFNEPCVILLLDAQRVGRFVGSEAL